MSTGTHPGQPIGPWKEHPGDVTNVIPADGPKRSAPRRSGWVVFLEVATGILTGFALII